MPEPQYVQKFRRQWLSNPELEKWLVEKKQGEGKSVPQCKYCQFILPPKLSDLKSHSKTKKHLTHAEPFSHARQVVLPFLLKKVSSEIQLTEGKMALFIATRDHLNNLCFKCFRNSKIASQIHVLRSKCSSVIKSVLYPHIMSEIRSAVRNSYYSLLIDESTDITANKYLGIAIIYYDEVK